MTETTHRGCPVAHTDFTGTTPLYEHYRMLDEDREEARFLFNDTTERGFFMLQRYDDVREGFQQHETWTTAVRSALRPDVSDEPLLPQDLNGPDHVKLRRILNQFFAPAAVRRMEPMAQQRCIELIEELQQVGSCDFVAEFAIRYPTDMFLALLGLPVSDGEQFLEWSDDYFSALLAGDPARAATAKSSIMSYFDDAVNERRANPRDPKEDMVTRLVEARIDDVPLTQDEILTICLTLMLAGLDTTRSALGYIYTHLANNPADRQALIDDPTLIPKAVEEFLRLYPWSSRPDVRSRSRRASRTSSWTRETSSGSASRRPTAIRASSTTPISSTSTGPTPTSTWPSEADRTAVWACTWRDSSSRWSWRSGTSAFRSIAWRPEPSCGSAACS